MNQSKNSTKRKVKLQPHNTHAFPKLKQALEKADMWHLTEIKPENPKERRDDQILKRFFAESNNVPEDVFQTVLD
jgi:hypothetical protein